VFLYQSIDVFITGSMNQRLHVGLLLFEILLMPK